jgi:glycosyltransferase involved in cell wall biosynthesis
MTICFVTDAFPPSIGGVATFYQHLSLQLIEQGHRIIILTAGQNSGDEDSVVVSGSMIKVNLQKEYLLYYSKYKPYFRPGGHDAPHWISMGMSIRNWLLKNASGYEIEIIEVSDYGGLGFFLIHSSLPPYIISANGSLMQLDKYSNFASSAHIKVLKNLELLSFKYAGAIIAHSPFNRSSLEKILSVKIEFVEAPWVDHFIPFESSGANSPVVAGGLHSTKGVLLLADAIESIRKTRPEFKIRWIGYDTYTAPSQVKMSDYLSQRYKESWQINLIWNGPLSWEETFHEIAQASFVIIPSIWESFSYVALEAARMRKPLIITNTTGASYLFEHEKNALIIEDDFSQLSQAILYLIDNPEKAVKMGEAAEEIFTSHLDLKRSAKQRIDIYTSSIDSNKTPNDVFEKEISFLNSYLTVSRKLYYRFRAVLKKLFKGR